MILETIHSPEDVKALDKSQLPLLCGELREFLVEMEDEAGDRHVVIRLRQIQIEFLVQRVDLHTAREQVLMLAHPLSHMGLHIVLILDLAKDLLH